MAFITSAYSLEHHNARQRNSCGDSSGQEHSVVVSSRHLRSWHDRLDSSGQVSCVEVSSGHVTIRHDGLYSKSAVIYTIVDKSQVGKYSYLL